MIIIGTGRAAWERFLLAAIVVICGAGAGATPTTLSAAPSPAPHKVVILVAGLGSSLTAAAASGPCSGSSSWQAIDAALAADGFSCADTLVYSYTGSTIDASGTWRPAPYSCYDTGDHVATSVGELFTLMTTYRVNHPDAQFVLIGHSLGGLLALEASAEMPAGSISSVVTIDSPLKGASRRNLEQFTRLVQPFIAYAGCSKVLWDSDAARDIATLHNRKTRQKASRAATAIVQGGRGKGFRYMTIGNASDCLWKPVACKIRGKWGNDSGTMVVKAANSNKLYPLGTGGCNLSNVINKHGVVQIRNVPKITCIATSHGLALQTPSVVQAIVRFVGPGSSASR